MASSWGRRCTTPAWPDRCGRSWTGCSTPAGANFRFKPAAGIAVARRAGAIEAADQINKYFQINCQPLVSSSYWNIAYGRTPGEAEGDGEGLHTMRVLGRNMAWMLKCIEAGRAAGINAPGMEPKVMTNVVREDLLGE